MTYLCRRCCCYHKGTYFQANHNTLLLSCLLSNVVVATTKVRIFKQITTEKILEATEPQLLLLPQRYVFSSKSQRGRQTVVGSRGCCCYHKGTYFQANHNRQLENEVHHHVVVATTKVRIFKQITTIVINYVHSFQLLLLPQRYVFSSKSQPMQERRCKKSCCCCYHKGTYFQANHNIIK